jgi:hypothetical protein
MKVLIQFGKINKITNVFYKHNHAQLTVTLNHDTASSGLFFRLKSDGTGGLPRPDLLLSPEPLLEILPPLPPELPA